MIDFSTCKEEINKYKGSEKKKTLIYDGKKYLVKFPDPLRQKNKNISYINNAFSEYVGSQIFKIIGFETQKTELGYYIFNGVKKIVCACEDFTTEDNALYEFENLANSTMLDKKVETELEDIIKIIKENANLINTEETIEKFWDMFIVDCLIGNSDRHNGNGGFLKDKKQGTIKFSPIYDCGSCLNPLLDDEEIEKISEVETKNLILNSYSCIKIKGKKINYAQYISAMENNDCNKALIRIFPKIDLNKIVNMINEIPCMSEIRKKFYINVIEQRYSQILEKTYKKLQDRLI